MSRIVWARTLTDYRPLVHAVEENRQRPANRNERGYLGLHPETPQQLVKVMTTDCGAAAVMGWLLEPEPDPLYPLKERCVRFEQSGVHLLDKHATAIQARRCRRCWPGEPR